MDPFSMRQYSGFKIVKDNAQHNDRS